MAAEHPASTVGLDLTSWEEAEAYFGLELPENTYLQEQLQSGFRAALSSDSEGPTALEWTAEYLDSGVRLEVWVTAYTQRMELPDHPVSQSHLLPSDTQYTTEEHTAPNGLSAVMTTVEQGPEDPITTNGAPGCSAPTSRWAGCGTVWTPMIGRSSAGTGGAGGAAERLHAVSCLGRSLRGGRPRRKFYRSSRLGVP